MKTKYRNKQLVISHEQHEKIGVELLLLQRFLAVCGVSNDSDMKAVAELRRMWSEDFKEVS